MQLAVYILASQTCGTLFVGVTYNLDDLKYLLPADESDLRL